MFTPERGSTRRLSFLHHIRSGILLDSVHCSKKKVCVGISCLLIVPTVLARDRAWMPLASLNQGAILDVLCSAILMGTK